MDLMPLVVVYATALLMLTVVLICWLREHKVRNFFLVGVIPVLLAIAGQALSFFLWSCQGAFGLIAHLLMALYVLPIFMVLAVIAMALFLRRFTRKQQGLRRIYFVYAAIPVLYVMLLPAGVVLSMIIDYWFL